MNYNGKGVGHFLNLKHDMDKNKQHHHVTFTKVNTQH